MPPTALARFTVAWHSEDDLAGVRDYDVQYKEGPLGQWQGWLTGEALQRIGNGTNSIVG